MESKVHLGHRGDDFDFGAFDPLTPRQVEALSKAAGYDGDSSDLIPYLKGLPQVALNEARDQVRGIGDEPAPLAAPAASAAPIPEGAKETYWRASSAARR